MLQRNDYCYILDIIFMLFVKTIALCLGLSRQSDITQLAAFDGKEAFNNYIMPRKVITATASSITGLFFDFNTNQIYHHGSPVDSKGLHTVLLE